MSDDQCGSGMEREFGYSCHGCGLQTFQISMEGYRVDRAKCNRCGTVVHFKDTSQTTDTDRTQDGDTQ